VYALVDFDWDFVAVTAPVLLVTGLLLTPRARENPGRRPLAAVGALVVGAACLYSVTLPWLAGRRVNQVYAAIGSDPRHALALADSAHHLNPLSVDALTAIADAAEASGDNARAWGALTRAADGQRDNWEPRYNLGVFEIDVLGDPCRAYFDLNRSYTLDRWGLPGQPGGPLDRARRAVNAGACARG